MVRSGIVLAALLFAQCGDPVAPPAGSGVDLILEVSASQGGPGDVIVATGTATNRTSRSVLYFEGCSEETRVWFEVLGPNGEAVQVVPPGPRPLCADFIRELPRRGVVESALQFDGTLYDAEGQAYPAPAGRYVLVARFRWWSAMHEPGTVVQEQRAEFDWRPRR